jgi:hypothetical protein
MKKTINCSADVMAPALMKMALLQLVLPEKVFKLFHLKLVKIKKRLP